MNGKAGNHQKLIQSNPTSHPKNQKGKKHTHTFEKRSRKARNVIRMNSSFQTGSHLASVTAITVPSTLTYFLF